MKIRIKGNTIRLRLSRSEVAIFEKTGILEERTEFADGVFMYALQAGALDSAITASLVGSRITVTVPAQQAAQWAASDLVGLSHTMDTGNGGTLALLIEKDFKCIDAAVSEDQSDNFEHPTKTC